MTHQPSAATRGPSPAAAAATGETPQWDFKRMDLFIQALTRTRSVAAAARAAGMSRQAAYKLRARLRGHPFDRAWEAAMAPREYFLRMVASHERGDTGLQVVTQGDGG